MQGNCLAFYYGGSEGRGRAGTVCLIHVVQCRREVAAEGADMTQQLGLKYSHEMHVVHHEDRQARLVASRHGPGFIGFGALYDPPRF
jgi:hypothetical protein